MVRTRNQKKGAISKKRTERIDVLFDKEVDMDVRKDARREKQVWYPKERDDFRAIPVAVKAGFMEEEEERNPQKNRKYIKKLTKKKKGWSSKQFFMRRANNLKAIKSNRFGFIKVDISPSQVVPQVLRFLFHTWKDNTDLSILGLHLKDLLSNSKRFKKLDKDRISIAQRLKVFVRN
eukprot:TRINITY_DN782110_c0_g1_i1.p1 TRINITY_DN782110_c0_g1~~TRINITY_DN782110_c0_g1_i1.p1  ORF type:complete len:177 (-),score=39.84 TRINITY_DN782110_c0_g1_i1:36-566(-)